MKKLKLYYRIIKTMKNNWKIKKFNFKSLLRTNKIHNKSLIKKVKYFMKNN